MFPGFDAFFNLNHETYMTHLVSGTSINKPPIHEGMGVAYAP